MLSYKDRSYCSHLACTETKCERYLTVGDQHAAANMNLPVCYSDFTDCIHFPLNDKLGDRGMTDDNANPNRSPDPQGRLDSLARCTDYQLLHPATVGELRRFLEPFDDDCPLMAMNWGAFRYVLDGEGNGKVQYT